MNDRQLESNSGHLTHALLGILASVLLSIISVNTLAHDGHVDKDAQLACVQKVLRESCQYVKETDKNIAKVYSGFCQEISHNKLCVRNQPIQTIVLEAQPN
ncbi:MAG: CII-binding regulator of phage lambda lysogenization HflD [Paraglaciecola sp.]|jgi:CII-binding regulator of phage lambda lysogenization HflD